MARRRSCWPRPITRRRAGLIAGVVLAAVAYPVAAVTGLGAKATAHAVEHKTNILRTALPAETSYLYAPDGKTLLTMFYEEYRQYTTSSDMSPNIQQAIVAAEDYRFYQHHGVDPKGVARAFVANARSGGGVPGRLDADHAVRPDGAARQRADTPGGPGGHRADQPAQGRARCGWRSSSRRG